MADKSLAGKTDRCREVERVAGLSPLAQSAEFDARLEEVLHIAQEVGDDFGGLPDVAAREPVSRRRRPKTSKEFDPQATEQLELLRHSYRNADWETTSRLGHLLLESLALASSVPECEGIHLISSAKLRKAAIEEWLLFVLVVMDQRLSPTFHERPR